MVAAQVLHWRSNYSLLLVRDYIPSTIDTVSFSTYQMSTEVLYLRGKDCSDVIDKFIINTIIVYMVIDFTDELCKIVVD